MTDSRPADNLPPLISASAQGGSAPSGASASADAWSPTTAVPDGAPVFPRYDTAWLGAVLPGAAQALGVTVEVPALTLPTARSVCVVVVDGLGRMLLEETADRAPFLTSLMPGSITLTAGCPSTTATSMGSFGTGLPPGRHGLVGYEVMDPARGVLLNELKWDPGTDPLAWQPHPTMFEELADHGVAVTRIGNPGFDGSGLTLAALRGGAFVGEKRLDTRVDVAVAALSRPGRGLVYLYWGALDGAGHQHGWRSPQWRRQLRHVDRELARLARRLAPEPCSSSPATTAWSMCRTRIGWISPTDRTCRPGSGSWGRRQIRAGLLRTGRRPGCRRHTRRRTGRPRPGPHPGRGDRRRLVRNRRRPDPTPAGRRARRRDRLIRADRLPDRGRTHPAADRAARLADRRRTAGATADPHPLIDPFPEICADHLSTAEDTSPTRSTTHAVSPFTRDDLRTSEPRVASSPGPHDTHPRRNGAPRSPAGAHGQRLDRSPRLRRHASRRPRPRRSARPIARHGEVLTVLVRAWFTPPEGDGARLDECSVRTAQR